MVLLFSVLSIRTGPPPTCSVCKEHEASFAYNTGAVHTSEEMAQYCCIDCAKKLLGKLWDILGRCGSVVSSTEPSRELSAKVSGTEDGQRASGRGITDREVAETDICKGPEIGNNFKIDPESRIEEAHVNLWPVEDEPVTPLRFLPKLKKNYDPVIWQIFLPH